MKERSERDGAICAALLDGLASADVARAFGLTRERIRQIAAQAGLSPADLPGFRRSAWVLYREAVAAEAEARVKEAVDREKASRALAFRGRQEQCAVLRRRGASYKEIGAVLGMDARSAWRLALGADPTLRLRRRAR